jgi:hypothetical protein
VWGNRDRAEQSDGAVAFQASAAHQVLAIPCDQHRAEVGVYACGGKSAVCEERMQSGKVCLLFLGDLAHCFMPFADPGSLQFEMRWVFHIVKNYLFTALSQWPSVGGPSSGRGSCCSLLRGNRRARMWIPLLSLSCS